MKKIIAICLVVLLVCSISTPAFANMSFNARISQTEVSKLIKIINSDTLNYDEEALLKIFIDLGVPEERAIALVEKNEEYGTRDVTLIIIIAALIIAAFTFGLNEVYHQGVAYAHDTQGGCTTMNSLSSSQFSSLIWQVARVPSFVSRRFYNGYHDTARLYSQSSIEQIRFCALPTDIIGQKAA